MFVSLSAGNLLQLTIRCSSSMGEQIMNNIKGISSDAVCLNCHDIDDVFYTIRIACYGNIDMDAYIVRVFDILKTAGDYNWQLMAGTGKMWFSTSNDCLAVSDS